LQFCAFQIIKYSLKKFHGVLDVALEDGFYKGKIKKKPRGKRKKDGL